MIHNVEQRTDEWLALRLGRVTSSSAADAIGFRKDGKESAARRDYRVQLATERIVGRPCGSEYRNADMDRGTALEPEAVAAYEAATGNIVMPVGFVSHDTLMAGYSPDGLVGSDGLIEAKCPRPANHLANLRGGVVPADYIPQLIHAFWCCPERAWVDFVSYSPVFPDDLQLFVVRFERDDAAVNDYARAATAFLKEVDAEVKAIESLRRKAA